MHVFADLLERVVDIDPPVTIMPAVPVGELMPVQHAAVEDLGLHRDVLPAVARDQLFRDAVEDILILVTDIEILRTHA